MQRTAWEPCTCSHSASLILKHAYTTSSVCIRLCLPALMKLSLAMLTVISESFFFHSSAALAPTHSESQMSPDAGD